MPNKVTSYIFIFLATLMLFGHNFIPHTHGICHHSACEEVNSNSHDLFHNIQDILGQKEICSMTYKVQKSFSFEKAVLIIAYTVFAFLFFKKTKKESFLIKNEHLVLKNHFFNTFSYRGPPTTF